MRRTQTSLFTRRPWTCTLCRARHHSSVASTTTATASTRTGKSKTKLPNEPARTRFAPSPTGYLHLGSLRTALFNYLLAKRTGGQFLLRLEDTDQKRTVTGAEERLYEDLQWAGLQWDEGPIVGGPFGPYRQSERTDVYRKHAHGLISSGYAYRCFCTPDRLDTFARHRSQAGLPPGYDRKCAVISSAESAERASKGEAHVVRFKVDGYPMFKDIVYGNTGQNRSSKAHEFIDRVYDDPILLKSDGHPTYHLANVVDDHCMKITHVIRGTEWMPSTPMHVALYNAFKWTPPRFGHVPLLVDKNGQKLSKRNADIDLSFFKDKQGVLAASLINFAALLGWSHSQKSDVFSMEELEQLFNLKITRGNTVVAFEKLWFLQKAHAQRFAASGGPEFDEMVSKISAAVQSTVSMEQLAPILQSRSLEEYIRPLLRADAKSYTNAEEFGKRNSTFFSASLDRPPYIPVSAAAKKDTQPLIVPISALHTAAAALCLVPNSHWTVETHRANISSYNGSAAVIIRSQEPTTNSTEQTTSDKQSTSKTQGDLEDTQMTAKPSSDKTFKQELYAYLRWALSAGAPGPGIPETMAILGRTETVRRIQEARELTATATDGRRARGKEMEEEEKNLAWMGSLAPASTPAGTPTSVRGK